LNYRTAGIVTPYRPRRPLSAGRGHIARISFWFSFSRAYCSITGHVKRLIMAEREAGEPAPIPIPDEALPTEDDLRKMLGTTRRTFGKARRKLGLTEGTLQVGQIMDLAVETRRVSVHEISYSLLEHTASTSPQWRDAIDRELEQWFAGATGRLIDRAQFHRTARTVLPEKIYQEMTGGDTDNRPPEY
jgi:hypothetical protein